MGNFITVMLLALGYPAFSAEKIDVPNKLRQRLKSFEPSAVAYLSDLDQYLIASDDTDKNDSPILFLMSENGKVDKTPLIISGMEKMTDIESISQDEQDNLIILSSMSLNKNGKNLKERNMIVKARRQGQKITVINQVELRPLLLKGLKNVQIPELKSIQDLFKSDLNVEASFIKNGEFYIGLKGPQPESGVALILNLGQLDDLFSHQKINLHLWKMINFADISGEQDLLSEAVVAENNLFLLTTNPNGTGRAWEFEPSTNKLSIVQEFRELNPEGLAIRSDLGAMLITFDQHDDTGMFTRINFKY